MNFIDVIILIILAFGALLGWKHGFFSQLVSFVGVLLIIVLAYFLKGYVSQFFYQYLPFFEFGGVLKGVTVLNIALYETIAFLIMVSVLVVIFKVVLFATDVLETVLKLTIILGIPSKILGAIFGALEYLIFVFIGLFVLSTPAFNLDFIGSKFYGALLKQTPLLSNMVSDNLKMFEEFASLKDKYEGETNANEFNLETLDLFLKYHITDVNSVETLIEHDKLKLDGVEEVLEKYKKEEK